MLTGKVSTSSCSSCFKVKILPPLKPVIGPNTAEQLATNGQMKLFVSEGNPHCLKVLAAVELTGVQCDVQYVNHEGKKAWLA